MSQTAQSHATIDSKSIKFADNAKEVSVTEMKYLNKDHITALPESNKKKSERLIKQIRGPLVDITQN
jgi:hypothetical protein